MSQEDLALIINRSLIRNSQFLFLEVTTPSHVPAFPGKNMLLFTHKAGSQPGLLVLLSDAAKRGMHKQPIMSSLTEEVCEPKRLVMMDNGHAGSVECHYAQDKPIEHLGFHHVTNRDAQEPFLVPEV